MVKGYVKQQFEGVIEGVVVYDEATYELALEILEKVETKYGVEVEGYFIESVVGELDIWLYQDGYDSSIITEAVDKILEDHETFDEDMFEGSEAEQILYEAHMVSRMYM